MEVEEGKGPAPDPEYREGYVHVTVRDGTQFWTAYIPRETLDAESDADSTQARLLEALRNRPELVPGGMAAQRLTQVDLPDMFQLGDEAWKYGFNVTR
jgi:hypothetical protein